ncbi:hypothetical protein [Pseudonocardia sp. TRM90224]|uniref:hypothetical protein n=1 Tax=Pseudonocardia sp. TRM90224 TaxID=2812678 RepID=UPI001E42334E|nr:hypothetical protein [Pseudonocardia sp. TRM90224]
MAPPPADAPDGTLGPTIPEEWCRLCWRERLVWRGGHWWLDHIGPVDKCTHDCHTGFTFLESTS